MTRGRKNKMEIITRQELNDLLILSAIKKMPVKSKKQAGFMGLIAAGKKKVKGLNKKKAKEFLRGVKVKMLPKNK